jgi:hypothetical protein
MRTSSPEQGVKRSGVLSVKALKNQFVAWFECCFVGKEKRCEDYVDNVF